MFFGCFNVIFPDIKWLFGCYKLFTVPVKWSWLDISPFSFFYCILPMFNTGLMIKCADDEVLRIREQFAKAITNKIINALHIQFFCQTFLYTINNSQFSGTLFCFF